MACDVTRTLNNRANKQREKHMLRLMERYTARIQEFNAWSLPYSWLITYFETADKTHEQICTEFFCNTNNLVFAAMIFEAQMLPLQVTIVYIEFNSLVTL